MDFELPEELRLLKDNLRKFVDKELIPLEREVVNDIRLQKELPKKLRPKVDELGLWQYDVPEEFGGLGLGMMAKVIVWSEISRTTSLPSRSRQHLRLSGQSDPLHARRPRARRIPAAGHQRREDVLLRADRGRRRLRSRRHAHQRRARRRRLRHQRRQALHHRRRRGRLCAGVRGDRPGEARPRRHHRLPGRHEHARAQGRRLLRPDGRRQALRDRLRQCPRAGLEAHRPGGRRLQARAVLAQLRPHPPRRALARRDGALLRARLRLRQATQDLRRATSPSGSRCSGRSPTSTWTCTSSA